MSSIKDQVKDKAADVAVGVGAAIVTRGLRGIFDRAARKRPNGLVARFRRFFGIATPEQTLPELAREYVDELQRQSRDSTPPQRPSAKRGAR